VIRAPAPRPLDAAGDSAKVSRAKWRGTALENERRIGESRNNYGCVVDRFAAGATFAACTRSLSP
jgi:hypothetical protein